MSLSQFKRVQACVLAVGLLMGGVLASAPARAQTTTGDFLPPGDVTGDLEVTIRDAIEVLQYLVGRRPLRGAEITAADVAPANPPGRMWGNGRVTVDDAVRILRRSVGLEPDPWPGGPVRHFTPNGVRHTLTQASSPYVFTVNSGVRVTGRLLDERRRPLSADLYYWNSTRRLLGRVTTDAAGQFSFQAPLGQYRFSTITRVTDATKGATVEIPTPNILTLQISEGMPPIEIQRGALPTLFTVKARLTSLPPNFTPVRVEYIDLERQFEFAPPPALGRSGALKNGVFTALLPRGTYKALAILNKKDAKGEVIGTVAVIPEQSVGVFQNRDVNLFLPSIGSLSGSFTIPGIANLTGRVLARTIIPTQFGGGGEGRIANGAYQIPLQNGYSYRFFFLPDLLNPSASPGQEIAYVGDDRAVTGNMMQNVILPLPLPVSRPHTLWIGDEFGRPVPHARVQLASFFLAGASQDYELRAEADANAHGVVSLNIPEGTYQITAGPSRSISTVIEVDAPVE